MIRTLVVLLALVEAGWMVFDGAHAFATGDYFTPRDGVHAGQLGPWAGLVSKVGIQPRSTLMKSAFVGYGALWLGVTAAFAVGFRWAWWAMVAAAVGSLWYLPVGTAAGVVQLALLLMPQLRS